MKKNKVNLSYPLRNWQALGESLKSDKAIQRQQRSASCTDPDPLAHRSPASALLCVHGLPQGKTAG